MRLGIPLSITVALVALGGVLVIVPSFAAEVPEIFSGGHTASAATTSGRVLTLYGLEQPLTLEQLASRADMIAIGTVVSDEIVRFAANKAIPAGQRDPRLDAIGAYHDATFAVSESLKGAAATTLSVRWLASTAELRVAQQGLPQLTVGTRYVLLLQNGTGAFTGGYIVVSAHGVGVVRDNSVAFDKYGQLDLADIRRIARR